jgi:hypothetical protein
MSAPEPEFNEEETRQIFRVAKRLAAKQNEPEGTKFMKYLNTVLLGIIITCGGTFSGFMGMRSISQGETLASIQASQVTRTEVEAKLAVIQSDVSLKLAAITNEQIGLRSKLTDMEIRQAAVAAALQKKEGL